MIEARAEQQREQKRLVRVRAAARKEQAKAGGEPTAKLAAVLR